VRTMLVPAIAVLLGDRFWWPRRVGVGVGVGVGAEASADSPVHR
jgi:RND superfamily putative drug exporter